MSDALGDDGGNSGLQATERSRVSLRLGPLACSSRDARLAGRLEAYGALASRVPARERTVLSSRWTSGAVHLPEPLPQPVPVGDRVTGWLVMREVILGTAASSRALLSASGDVRAHLVADDPDADALLDAVLFELLGRAGYLMVHASLVEVDGRGCMICGRSGAGKSTLAWLLSSAGAALVTDDVALLDVAASDITAVGTMQTLRLREPRSGSQSAEGNGKAHVSAARVQQSGRTKLALIVLLRGDHPPQSAAGSVRGDGLAALLPHVALTLDAGAADRQLSLLEAVAKTPMSVVATGQELLDSPPAALRLVRSLLGEGSAAST